MFLGFWGWEKGALEKKKNGENSEGDEKKMREETQKIDEPLWKAIWGIKKKLGIKPSYDSASPPLGIHPEESESWKKYRYPIVHCSIICNS